MSEANQSDSTTDMLLKGFVFGTVLMDKMSRIEREIQKLRDENRQFMQQFFKDIKPLTDFIRSRRSHRSSLTEKKTSKTIALRSLAKYDCQDKIDYLEDSDETTSSSKETETNCESASNDPSVVLPGEVDDTSINACNLDDISDYSDITSSRTLPSSLMSLQSNSDSDIWWSAKSSLEDLTAIDCQLINENTQTETTISAVFQISKLEDPQQLDVEESVLKELNESDWDEDEMLSKVTFVEPKDEVNEETLFEEKCLLWRFHSSTDLRDYGTCNLKLLKNIQTKRLRCLAIDQETTVDNESILNFAVGRGFKFSRGKQSDKVLVWSCMDFSSLSLSKGEQHTFICQFENQTQLTIFEKIVIQFIDKVN
ncbi:hypothetical protein M3Y94_00120800 [Aphelenchoides besseyi]|nr:hypothetical protein M3Y94_00120800 [Aphelenchoides besseyi]KAI6237423.1 hypothetical protein M3Y95_00263500 [Aphelenchoides besseyi]